MKIYLLKKFNIEFKHINNRIVSLDKLFRLLFTNSPAFEKICSLGTLVAGITRILNANLNNLGNDNL
jgi:hypothetical protein